MCSPFKSLVFMDLEATTLPQFRPEITELSFLACSTDHFVNASATDLPRVQHKLTLCVNPVKRIAPEAVLITGLDNFLLQNENVLCAKNLKLISNFLDCLQKPICLVAHNGKGFDFPLLAQNFQEWHMVSVRRIPINYLY